MPPWLVERLEWLSDEHAARVSLGGPSSPEALDGIDPARAGRDLLPYLPITGEVVNRRTTNWCVAPAPTRGWAKLVHPDLDVEEAYERLWTSIAHVCRLDEDDPEAGWRERARTIEGAAARLTERRFDAIRLHGPGTDLTIGLFGSSSWHGADFETIDGLRHFPNIPSEEVFTTPDPGRADGFVTATRPLEVYGAIMDGIRVEFAGGRAVRIDAERGADTLRSIAAQDDGASFLGELALVDGEGRIGPLGTVFYDTLLDENAASHIALGSAYAARCGRRGGQGADQPQQDPRRLHDRRARARRRRHHARRRDRAGAAQRRLADLISVRKQESTKWIPALGCICPQTRIRRADSRREDPCPPPAGADP